jgi:hypothetical protein
LPYPTSDIAQIRDRFQTLGPTPRLCLDFSEEQVKEFVDDRVHAINQSGLKLQNLMDDLITEGRGLRMGSTDAQKSTTPNMSGISHKICLIRRSKDGHTIHPMTESVRSLLAFKLKILQDQMLLDMWQRFSNFADARGMTGVIFEAYVQKCFTKEINISAELIFRTNSRTSRWHARIGSFELRPESSRSCLLFHYYSSPDDS